LAIGGEILESLRLASDNNKPKAAMSSHDWRMTMVSDRLLSEVERQRKYLGRLPDNFEFPIFNSKQALESQRRNGYRDTASAAREIVDNALEAGAKRIHVVFEHKTSKQRRDLVTSIAFIDDGSGMLPKMIQYALTLGGGTHFDEPDFIGKFAFGLPNASINQTLRVEVYSRTKKADDIMRAVLDVNEVKQHGLQTVFPPEKAELPKFVREYLKRTKFNFDHGTVVVWQAPDRLTYRTAAPLKEHILDDFGVTYRYLLEGDIELLVEGKRVEVVDPLFLDPKGRYYLAPDKEQAPDKGGAVEVLNRSFTVRYYTDSDSGTPHLEKVQDMSEIDDKDPSLVTYGPIHLRVSRLPYGFATKKEYKVDEFSPKRMEIRQSRRGMSFVRAGREIETMDAFPHTTRDISHGLGEWPLLQSYAYHWGVEVKFGPELDEVFGITNDKQRVRPIEDFWRVLTAKNDIELDRILRAENNWQSKLRHEKEEARKKAKREALMAPSNDPTPGEQAAAAVDVVTGKGAKVPAHTLGQVQASTEEETKRRIGVSATTKEEAAAAIESERKRRPYKIEYFEGQHDAFYQPDWGPGGQVVVRVNRTHPFFSVLYGDLFNIEGGLRAKESVDVLLIALAKAELTAEVDLTKQFYETQRKENWSPFLATALKALANSLDAVDGEDEKEETGQEVVAA